MAAPRAVLVPAPAKINLVLAVLGNRPDGFHEIRSWMVPLALADRLRVERAPRGLRLEVSGAEGLDGPENLAYRAAADFIARYGRPAGARLRLDKRVPVAAGLGGGSSDAAATLLGLARLAEIDDPEGLAGLAERLGSDVPFFLARRPAWVSGRGETVEPAPRPPPLGLLLVKPPFGICAASAYAAWRPSRLTRSRPSVNPWSNGGPSREDEAVLTVETVAAMLRNDLQAGVVRTRPELRSVLARLAQAGACGVAMSGSGSTCFGLFRGPREARLAAARFVRRPGETLLVTRPAARPGAVRILG